MRGVMLIGHRGARYEAPENTLSGFRHALNLGLSAVEFDVRMTADGHLVVIHDATVDRTTDGTGNVSDLTLAEIRALDARSIFPEWAEPCHVPTFAEVLDIVGHLPELLIEIKSDERERLEQIVPAMIAEIHRRGISRQVTLTSFDPVALEIALRQSPEVRRGYIGEWDGEQFLRDAVRLHCGQVDIRHSSGDHGLAMKAKSLGMRVVCWPTNSPEELESALTFDPDLFCTDRPSLLRELYAAANVSSGGRTRGGRQL